MYQEFQIRDKTKICDIRDKTKIYDIVYSKEILGWWQIDTTRIACLRCAESDTDYVVRYVDGEMTRICNFCIKKLHDTYVIRNESKITKDYSGTPQE